MSKQIQKISLFVQLIIGTALTAISMGMIVIPMNFSAAGVTGFAVVLNTFLPISVSILVLSVNLLFLVMGYIFLGKSFLIKTVIYSILFPFMLEFFLKYPFVSIEADPLVCVIVAGVLLGVGVGMVIRCGASTGGFGIPALILHRKFKVPVGTVLNVTDALVIFIQFFNKTPLQTVYGILTITISAFIADRIVSFGTGEAQITIISPQNESIRIALMNQADVGLTSFPAKTGYLQNSQTVIVSVVPYDKVPDIKRVITSIDPTAFVIISRVQNVLGKGYTINR